MDERVVILASVCGKHHDDDCFSCRSAKASNDDRITTMQAREAAIRKVRDGYASQAKFADIEAVGYFREFIRRIDEALVTSDLAEGN